MSGSEPDAPHWFRRWTGDPVHDAVVSARLGTLQAGMRSARAVDGRAEARATTRLGLVHAARVRVGRALVAFGAFVEGGSDCPDSTAARTA